MPSLISRRRTGDPTEQHHRKEVNGSYFQPRALTASAKRVRLDQAAGKPRPLRVVDWQRDAWAYFDDVPEFKQLILWRGNQLAKLDYFPATFDPNDIEGNPIPLDDEIAEMPPDVVGLASEIWGRFKSAYGGQKEVQRRLEINLEVAGEAHVIGLSPRPVEGEGGLETDWDFFVASTDELSSKTATGGRVTYRVRRSSSAKASEVIELNADDVMFRAWQSHGRFADDPDCSARGLLGEMEHLYLLSCQGRNEAKSRFSAGLLCVPNGLSAGTQPPGNTPAAQEPEDGGEARADPFLQELANVITAPIEDPEDNASVVPLVVRGEAAELAELRLVSLARVEDSTLDTRVEERVTRLARGLNAPPEVVQGSMQTTFANAKQIAKDKWEDYLQPRAVFMADVFTIGYLRPALLDAGVDPELVARIFVWFDASDLVEHPQLSTVALPAYDRFEITGDALRNALGFGPDDAPDAIEILVRMARTKGVLTPNVTNALLELLDGSVPIPDPEMPPTPGEAGGTGGESTGGAQAAQAGMTSGQRLADVARMLLLAEDIADRRTSNGNGKARTASAKGRYTPPARLPQPRTWRARPDLAVIAAQARRASSGRGTQAGRRLVEIDRELRNRTLIAAGAAMDRALERAGNRLRSRTASANKHILADVRPRFVAARLGKALVAEAGGEDDALAGAFDELGDQFLGWASTATDQAIDVAYGICGGFSTTTRDALGLRMADNADEAWGWMKDTLTNLAKGRLYDPTPSAPPLGEFDPSLNVPPGLVRQAIARAGGAAALATDSSGTGPNAWVALTGGIDPSGGLATGDLMMQTLQDEGAGREGYIWDYGAAFRKNPFEPHLALDGLQFEGFDDDVLANTEGWPEFPYYMPGDHDGCMCDAVPIIIPPDDAGTGSGGPDDLASMTADDVAAAAEEAAAADQAGPAPSAASYTDAELKAAKKDLTAVRAEIRGLAAATKNDALGELEKAEGGRMQWPPRRDERVVDKVTGRVYYVQPGGAQAGDWDWFYNLSEGERGRLTDYWCADGATGNTPDQLAEYWRAAHAGSDISDDEAIAQWLDQTRRHDMGSALTRGKLPSMARFGDVDPNRLIGTPYNLNVIYGNEELAIRHIADVTFNQAADDAARVLNYRPELGPAPWQMTRDEYVKEMFSINEAGAPVELTPGDEWNPPTYSQADMARLQRFDELLPMGVMTTDENGDLLDPGLIWDEIQSLAHIAGLS